MQKSSFRTDQITRPASVTIGLFNDSTDALADGDNYSNITTEPSDGNYVAQSASLDSSDVTVSLNSGNVRIVYAEQTFDMTNTTGTVDAYYVTGSFQSDVVNSQTSANQNLIFTGDLSQSYDLSNVTTFNLSNTGLDLN